MLHLITTASYFLTKRRFEYKAKSIMHSHLSSYLLALSIKDHRIEQLTSYYHPDVCLLAAFQSKFQVFRWEISFRFAISLLSMGAIAWPYDIYRVCLTTFNWWLFEENSLCSLWNVSDSRIRSKTSYLSTFRCENLKILQLIGLYYGCGSSQWAEEGIIIKLISLSFPHYFYICFVVGWCYVWESCRKKF